MYRDLRITVVIPCHNEEGGIAQALRQVPAVVDEVIVVDNASTDQTAAVARAAGARVVAELRKGYGRALKTGIEAATGDVVVTADGDGTYPLPAIPALVEHLVAGPWDFVSGSRFPLQNPRAMRRRNAFGNRALSLAMSVLFGHWFRDGLSGMWVFRREVYPRLKLLSDDWNISEEIKIEAVRHPQVRFTEFPIDYHERIGASKLMPWRVGWANLVYLFQMRLNCRPTPAEPLR
jgi:hypothetical protein